MVFKRHKSNDKSRIEEREPGSWNPKFPTRGEGQPTRTSGEEKGDRLDFPGFNVHLLVVVRAWEDL